MENRATFGRRIYQPHQLYDLKRGYFNRKINMFDEFWRDRSKPQTSPFASLKTRKILRKLSGDRN